MAALEWEEAALAGPDFVSHPLGIPLDRLVAARWLAASGDAEEARRLLRWADGAFYLHPITAYSYSLMFAVVADLERARIEDGLGYGTWPSWRRPAFVRNGAGRHEAGPSRGEWRSSLASLGMTAAGRARDDSPDYQRTCPPSPSDIQRPTPDNLEAP